MKSKRPTTAEVVAQARAKGFAVETQIQKQGNAPARIRVIGVVDPEGNRMSFPKSSSLGNNYLRERLGAKLSRKQIAQRRKASKARKKAKRKPSAIRKFKAIVKREIGESPYLGLSAKEIRGIAKRHKESVETILRKELLYLFRFVSEPGALESLAQEAQAYRLFKTAEKLRFGIEKRGAATHWKGGWGFLEDTFKILHQEIYAFGNRLDEMSGDVAKGAMTKEEMLSAIALADETLKSIAESGWAKRPKI